MSMFDWVKCSYGMATSESLYQCKNLDCCMDTYLIDEYGFLLKENFDIIMDDDQDVFCAYKKTIGYEPYDFTGELEFHKIENGEWDEWRATFKDGKIGDLVLFNQYRKNV